MPNRPKMPGFGMFFESGRQSAPIRTPGGYMGARPVEWWRPEREIAALPLSDAERAGWMGAFWSANAARATILRVARAHRVNPWGLLFVCLCRALVLRAPLMVAEPWAGIPLPLNMYVAVFGKPGSGKGLTEKLAARLVPFPAGLVKVFSPASGEAIAAQIVRLERDERGNATKLSRWRHLYAVYTEIGQLEAIMGRQGNTARAELLKGFSGESLGGDVKKAEESVTAPALSYSLGMSVGVQPAHMAVFRDGEEQGFPQRFVWTVTGDPGYTGPREEPGDVERWAAGAGLYDVQARAWRLVPLPRWVGEGAARVIDTSSIRWAYEPDEAGMATLTAYLNPEKAQGDVQADYLAHAVRVPLPAQALEDYRRAEDARAAYDALHDDEERPLDAHAIDVRTVLAVGLSLLDGAVDPEACDGTGAPNVTVEEWESSGHLLDMSRRNYLAACERGEEVEARRETRREKRRAIARTEGGEQATEERNEKLRANIMRVVDKHVTNDTNASRDGVAGWQINHDVRGGKTEIGMCVAELVSEGTLAVVGDADEWTKRRYLPTSMTSESKTASPVPMPDGSSLPTR